MTRELAREERASRDFPAAWDRDLATRDGLETEGELVAGVELSAATIAV